MRHRGSKTASLNPPCQLSPQPLARAHEEQPPGYQPRSLLEPAQSPRPPAAPPTRAALARSRQLESRQ